LSPAGDVSGHPAGARRSNNAAREIAAERLLFEKEKFSGLRPSAYVASKALFLALLIIVQSGWMALFVDLIVGFPGEVGSQVLLLVLVNAALTALCSPFRA
jgi:hypothetical protein